METDLHVSAGLARALRAGTCLVAPDGTVLAVSLEAAETFGWSGDPPALSLADLVAEPDRDRVAAALAAVFGSDMDDAGDPTTGARPAAATDSRSDGSAGLAHGAAPRPRPDARVALWLTADGLPAGPIPASLEAVHDHGEKAAALLVLPAGAAALAVAEAARREAERNARLLNVATGNAGVAPWFLDLATGAFTHYPEFGSILGWEPDDAPVRFAEVLDAIHPEDRPRADRELDRLKTGETTRARADFRIRDRHGHWKWCTTIASLRQEPQDPAPLICAATIDMTERMQNEHRLTRALAEAEAARAEAQEATDILRYSTESSKVVPWYHYPETGHGRIGPHLATLLGYPADFVIGPSVITGFIHPDDAQRAVADFSRLAKGEIDNITHDLRLRRADDSWCWFTVRGKLAARDDGEAPAMVCGSFTEIDRLKEDERRLAQAADEVHHAHDRLNALADTFPGALFEFAVRPDGTSHFPYTSARFAAIMGVPRSAYEKNANAVFTVVDPEDIARSEPIVRAAARARQPMRLEVRINHPEKGPRWLMNTATPIAEDDGTFTWFGTLLDITEQKATAERAAAATAAVVAEQARLNTLAANAPCALFEYRYDGAGFAGFDYYSSRFPEIFGVPRATLERDPGEFRRNVPADDLVEIQAVIARGVRDLTPITVTHRVEHPEKGLRWVLSAGTPVPRPDGTVTIYCSILDVTERMLAEREAERAAEALRQTNKRFVKLTKNAPGGLFECRFDPDRGVIFDFLSSNLYDLLGVDPAEVGSDNQKLFARVPPQDRDRIRAAVAHSAATLERLEMTHRVAHPARGLRWVLVSVEIVRAPDGTTTGYGSVVDVTDQRATESRALQAAEDLARAHARLTYLTDGATVGLFETHLAADGRSEITYSSARFAALMGFARSDAAVSRQRAFDRIHPGDRARVRSAIERSCRDLSPIHVRFRIDHPDQGLLWLEASATTPKPERGGFTWVAALHDVTSDVKREQDLRQAHRVAEQMRARNAEQALHDGLTGLPNRRFFDDVFDERRERAERGGARDCTLLRLDLDRFKHVNDTLGHAAGDRVLVRVGDVLRDCVRVGDFPSRNGGDEFSILMAPGATPAEARATAARVQAALAEPLIHDGRQCRFGASFGIARTDDILATGSDLHLFADAALYRAKSEGGNRIQAFTPELHHEILRDRSLAIDIHEALETDQLLPFFQPQVNATDGNLYGAEVLLRWDHPTDGIIAPGAFMHVAEQLRLVPDIDRVVMQKSLDVLERWRARGLVVPKISFNVSAGRMHDPDILAFASRFAELDTKVTFELLESILVEEENQAFRDNLDFVRGAGVDIEIDDFGSGHASIIGLMEIEPSALKIDQRIVFPVVREARARDLVRAIVEIAAALKINTVAEGVETEEHARILRQIGCNVFQGYHFSKPLSEQAFFDYAIRLRDRAR